MRAPTTAVRAALSAAAAAVLLTACGGSGGGSAAAGSSSDSSTGTTSSPAAGTSAPDGDIAAWCNSAVALSTDLSATLKAASSAPTQVAPILQKAADQYGEVKAPAAIAQDWGVVVGAVQTLATAAQTIDFTSPDAGKQLAASIGAQRGALDTATTNVQTYANANCPGASAAPTS
ncbi:hypothetical protein SAMN05661080_03639 [Modestobacter sp. DSM 44400]|uniref:hypothetical protein n=1 Tax=Modestobacter sp. DSM 44400 TaxID=1550230 RepID=UPI0008978DBC|nr:hypothetical protein [Modestobacter sp. DSM 44400]SDY49324.1 hypothetical protein SAMN05661080_03639 [Modestobacter sp. DSM 44400]